MEEEAEVKVLRRRTPDEIRVIVAELAGSGLTKTEFCRRHAMSLGTLNRYLQPDPTETSRATKGRFVAVEVTRPEIFADHGSEWSLAVALSGGRRIEVKAGFDESTLEQLIRLLEQR
jgi:hypothetical protein